MSTRQAFWALMVALTLAVAMATLAVGAESSPIPVDVLEGGDPRSDGAGPGIVGSPLLILAGVVLLGLATAGVTVLIVRLTQRR